MDAALRDRLSANLERCIVKASEPLRASSIAFSTSGTMYDGALIGSDTNLLTISSEQVALSMAAAVQDYGVERVVTMVTGAGEVSPIVLKILVDHVLRTGRTMAYSMVNENGETMFEFDDVRTSLPFYHPTPIMLAKVSTASLISNVIHADIDDLAALKRCAVDGIGRNFPLYDSASGYGAAVMTSSGKIFFSGQYSSPDKRLNTHAEMNAVLCAMMAGETEIVRIGVVSSKFTNEPCQMCGVCRQFLAEMCAKWNIDPAIYCFALEADALMVWQLNEYLPAPWTSKKW